MRGVHLDAHEALLIRQEIRPAEDRKRETGMPPIDTRGYRDFGKAYGPNDIVMPGGLEVQVDPARNGGADVLAIYTGTLLVNLKGTGPGAWFRGNIAFPVHTGNRRWTPRQIGAGWTFWEDGTVTLSLASIYNAGHANHGGHAVDAAIVYCSQPQPVAQPEDHIQVQALVAIRDNDAYLYRLSYQVTAKGRTEI